MLPHEDPFAVAPVPAAAATPPSTRNCRRFREESRKPLCMACSPLLEDESSGMAAFLGKLGRAWVTGTGLVLHAPAGHGHRLVTGRRGLDELAIQVRPSRTQVTPTGRLSQLLRRQQA